MSYQDWQDFFAVVVLAGVGILALVDAGTEMGMKWVIHIKWSLTWTLLRYFTQGCAIMLALYVLL